uniref:Uncharacterized protein n=1 Tax=Cucumis melo TaxID=3656 RepID=A0A9I9CCV9_CUCME
MEEGLELTPSVPTAPWYAWLMPRDDSVFLCQEELLLSSLPRGCRASDLNYYNSSNS